MFESYRHTGALVGAAMAIACGSSAGSEEPVQDTASPIISDAIVNLDLESNGAYLFNSGNYDLDTGVDVNVLDYTVPAEGGAGGATGEPMVTDTRGIVFLPEGPGPFPVAVFLHGNHNTCRSPVPFGEDGVLSDPNDDFTLTGECPADQYETPNHLGFNYLAEHLASHGYVAISINANRGITGHGLDEDPEDPDLILARGRLVLKHLALLRELHDGTRSPNPDFGLDLQNKLDFSHVGLMGHSRGGEGMRAAYYLHSIQDPNSYASALQGVTFEGIFEFAPVDLAVPQEAGATTPLQLDAPGAHRTVVLGSCDNDVRSFAGVGPFARRRAEESAGSDTFSSVFVVPGANHNFFNSEWQTLDGHPSDCPAGQYYLWEADWDDTKILHTPGSERQRRIGLMTLSAFFRGFIGQYQNREKYQKVFDPQYNLPTPLAELADAARESIWHDSTDVVTQLDSSHGSVGVACVEAVAHMATTGLERQLTRVEWDVGSGANEYDAHLWEPSQSLAGNWLISFSLARYQEYDVDPEAEIPTDFGIELLYEDGTTSAAVRLAEYAQVTNRLNEIAPCAENENTVEVEPGICEQTEYDVHVADCQGDFYPWLPYGEIGVCREYFPRQTRYLLFFEAPIEIKDFDLADGQLDGDVFNRPVRGLRFRFDGTAPGKIFLDQSYLLRSSPLGDVDANGTAEIIDALLIAQYYVGTPPPPHFNASLADVNCDGVLDIVDALLIAQHYVGTLEVFPCEQ